MDRTIQILKIVKANPGITIPQLEMAIYGFNVRKSYGPNGGSSYIRKTVQKLARLGLVKEYNVEDSDRKPGDRCCYHYRAIGF